MVEEEESAVGCEGEEGSHSSDGEPQEGEEGGDGEELEVRSGSFVPCEGAWL